MTTPTPTPTARPQLRLPGQAAAPEGPVDMTMMYVDAPRLPARPRGVRRRRAGARRSTTGRPGRRWPSAGRPSPRSCTTTTAARTSGSGRADATRADDDGRATLEAMEAEHAEIDPILRGVRGRVRSWLAEARREVPAPRSPSAWSRRGRASAAHLSTRRPRRSRCMQRVLTQRGVGARSRRSTSRSRRRPSGRSSRWCRGCCTGCPAGCARGARSRSPAGGCTSRCGCSPGARLRASGTRRAFGTWPERSEPVAGPAGRATTARPAGSAIPRSAARRRRRGVAARSRSPAAAAAMRQEGVDRARGALPDPAHGRLPGVRRQHGVGCGAEVGVAERQAGLAPRRPSRAARTSRLVRGRAGGRAAGAGRVLVPGARAGRPARRWRARGLSSSEMTGTTSSAGRPCHRRIARRAPADRVLGLGDVTRPASAAPAARGDPRASSKAPAIASHGTTMESSTRIAYGICIRSARAGEPRASSHIWSGPAELARARR